MNLADLLRNFIIFTCGEVYLKMTTALESVDISHTCRVCERTTRSGTHALSRAVCAGKRTVQKPPSPPAPLIIRCHSLVLSSSSSRSTRTRSPWWCRRRVICHRVHMNTSHSRSPGRGLGWTWSEPFTRTFTQAAGVRGVCWLGLATHSAQRGQELRGMSKSALMINR